MPPTRRPSKHRGAPTVILAKTIKGYGLGEAGEGRNITHQQKKLNEDELRRVPPPLRHPDLRRGRGRQAAFYKPPGRQPRDAVPARAPAGAGRLRARSADAPTVQAQAAEVGGLRRVLRRQRRPRGLDHDGLRAAAGAADARQEHRPLHRADRARRGPHLRHGALFRQFGIYSHVGQLYEPVDSDNVLYYREAKDGQILEEGITEAGSMSSFIAAGTRIPATASA